MIAAPPPADVVAADVARALAEDVGSGDISADLLPAGRRVRAAIRSREAAMLCGAPWADACFRALDPDARIEWAVQDGGRLEADGVFVSLVGDARALVTGERSAINFLQMLSGTATATAAYVDRVQGTGARILDTRKTVPGLRIAQKYAVRCGGGVNHRIGLYDAALIKDNHVVAAGGVAEAFRAVRKAYPGIPIEVEVDRIDQIEPVLAEGAEEILLDNFTVPQLKEAVELVAGRARLESSGGLTLDTARAVAETGVDFLAVGALTHSSPALDIALDLRGA